MKYILFIAFMFISLVSRAQSDTLSLDTDTVRVVSDTLRAVSDTTHRDVGYIRPLELDEAEVSYTASLSGNYASGTVDRFLVNTAHNVNFKLREFNVPLYVSYSYGKQNDMLKEREFSYVATPTYKLDRWRVYLNTEFEISNVRGILTRHLRGAGIGYVLYTKDENEISLSNLVLYEETRYTNELSRELFRNSTRLKVRLRYKTINVASTTFYQPSYEDLTNYRVNNNTTVSFKLINQLAFTISYQYAFESISVVTDKKKANTFVTAGFSFSHK